MNVQSAVHSHIDVTDALARLYLFLAQSIDSCVNEAAAAGYSKAERELHLASTRAMALDMLSVNQVVRRKVEQECERVLSLIALFLTDGPGKARALDDLKVERAVLKHKTMALSDLLAVFRAA
jgi:hypothetical protein